MTINLFDCDYALDCTPSILYVSSYGFSSLDIRINMAKDLNII